MSELIVEVVQLGSIEKHPNADTLSTTQVKGWNVIIKTGQYTPGDLAVYIPIDSMLPTSLVEQYELAYLKNGERVKTVKLRGYVSQGMLLPVPSEFNDPIFIGKDMSAFWDIKKWAPPAPAFNNRLGAGRQTKGNHHFKKYTSIEHHKNYPALFKDKELVDITEKIHGTNFRAGYVPKVNKTLWDKLKSIFSRDASYEFLIGSHNVQLNRGVKSLFRPTPTFYGTDVYSAIAKRYNLENVIPYGVVLYGEIYGKSIQDLTYGMDDIDVVFFDALVDGEYRTPSTFRSLCKTLDLPVVPTLYTGPYDKNILETYTTGKSLLCPHQIREGVIIKSARGENSPEIGRKVLKSINVDYLLRKNGTENN